METPTPQPEPQPQPQPQPPQTPVKVPLFEAALVTVATFFVFLFLSGSSLVAFGEAPTLVIGELLILAVPLIYLLSKHVDVKSYVRLDLNPRFVVIGLGCGVLLLLLNIVVSGALTYFFGTSKAVEQSNQLISSLSAEPWGFAAVAISLVLAGICEEFAFRGFLQNSIFKSLIRSKPSKYSASVAVIIAALVFGLFHVDPQGIYTASAFMSGIALGYVYHRWNYTTSATAHAFMNLIVLAFLLLGIG